MITGNAILEDNRTDELPLFVRPKATPADAVIEQRDRSMAQGAAREERADVLFFDRASNFVLRFLLHTGPASGEAITDACKKAGIVPLNDKAFGSVYMQLARAKLIEKDGFCPRKKGHGTSGGVIWKLVAT